MHEVPIFCLFQSAEDHRIFPSFFRAQWPRPLELRSTPSGLFSLRLMFERSKSESLRYVIVTRAGDTLSRRFLQTDFETYTQLQLPIN